MTARTTILLTISCATLLLTGCRTDGTQTAPNSNANTEQTAHNTTSNGIFIPPGLDTIEELKTALANVGASTTIEGDDPETGKHAEIKLRPNGDTYISDFIIKIGNQTYAATQNGQWVGPAANSNPFKDGALGTILFFSGVGTEHTVEETRDGYTIHTTKNNGTTPLTTTRLIVDANRRLDIIETRNETSDNPTSGTMTVTYTADDTPIDTPANPQPAPG